jgi:1,4-dihydroxy-2-naphthoate octaprenyltransferase
LGDIFVFIFFGLVAVCGTYFVQAGTITEAVVWAAVPMGFLATAILVINNLRDIDTDRATGKKTTAVRLGRTGAQVEYFGLIIGAYLTPLLMFMTGVSSGWILLSWVSLPMLKPLVQMVLRVKGRPLNNALAGTARLELVFSLFFSIGLLIEAI